MPNIHSTAIVSSEANIAVNVQIGPFCIIESDVVIGKNTIIQNNVTIKSGTRIGSGNNIYPYSVIGSIPQDLKYSGEYTEIFIGDNNIIREYVTLSRGTLDKNKTVIGSGCLFMANSHVGHDSIVGDGAIFANSVAIAGHVEIEEFVTLGGLTGVHQFVRIGSHSMIGAHSKIVKDVPPFCLFDGNPLTFQGLNVIGLKRRLFDDKSIDQIRKAYNILYKNSMNVSQAVNEIKNYLPTSTELKHLVDFIDSSKRGITR
jgi:UDP-N-acetylglucosamine acyltransferase